MIGQSKIGSLIEAAVNIAIGYAVAIAAQLVVFPWFGIVISLADNMAIGACFTAVSLMRSYAVRRVFNWWHVRSS